MKITKRIALPGFQREQSLSLRKNSLVLLLMLLCPILIIAAVNFCIIAQQSLNAMQNELRIHSERLLDQTERQFEAVPKVTDRHKQETGFFNAYQTDSLASYYYITDGLNKDSLWTAFFSDVFYMNYKGKYIISTQGKDGMDFYFTNVLLSKKLKTASTAVFKSDPEQIRTFRVHSKLTNDDGTLFLAPLETADDNTVVSSMAFVVYDSTMSALWDKVNENGFMTLSYNNEPIYSSNKQVNQAINEGNSLSNFLHGDSLTMCYSQNAFKVQWNIPRFTFFTRILGTVMVQAVITFLVLAVAVLLLLRYTHKSYAPVRQILQRIEPQYQQQNAMDELKYIDMAVSDLTYSKKFLEQTNEELRREKYLYYILDNQVTTGSALYQQCLSAGIRVDRHWFACILLEDTAENEKLFQNLNAEAKDSGQETNLYSMHIMDNKYMFLLCSDEKEDCLTQKLRQLSDGNDELVSVSRAVDSLENVRSAYLDACQREEKQTQSSDTTSMYPELELEALQEAVSVENTDKVEFALRMIKNRLASCSEMWRASAFVTVCSILNEGDRQKINRRVQQVPVPNPEAISGEIDVLFSEYLQRVGTQEEETAPHGHRSLGSLMQYLEANYCDSSFTIKRMAMDFHTSPSNLSHFFKKSTGQTISHFIDEMKVKRAEQLLLAGQRVNDVAQQLGYNSASVFIETFKRVRGVTPSVFRCSSETELIQKHSKP